MFLLDPCSGIVHAGGLYGPLIRDRSFMFWDGASISNVVNLSDGFWLLGCFIKLNLGSLSEVLFLYENLCS